MDNCAAQCDRLDIAILHLQSLAHAVPPTFYVLSEEIQKNNYYASFHRVLVWLQHLWRCARRRRMRCGQTERESRMLPLWLQRDKVAGQLIRIRARGRRALVLQRWAGKAVSK